MLWYSARMFPFGNLKRKRPRLFLFEQLYLNVEQYFNEKQILELKNFDNLQYFAHPEFIHLISMS